MLRFFQQSVKCLNAQKLGFYFAVFIIITFALSLFASLLYVPSSATTTSTTLAMQSFEGVGLVNADVVNVSNRAIVQCNATTTKAILESTPGVEKDKLFSLSNDLFSFTVSNETAFALVERGLQGQCDLKVLREASLRVTDEVISLSSNAGQQVNFTQRSLQPIQGLGGVVRGFVYSDTRIGDDILTAMYAVSPDGLLIGEATIQEQPRAAKLAFLNEVVSATVVNTTETFLLMQDVSWEDRLLDTVAIEEELNMSVAYSTQDYVLVKESKGKTLNTSFAKGMSFQGNDTLLDVELNFTDAALVRSELSGYELDFPNSTITINTDAAGIARAQQRFPNARFYVVAYVQPLNASIALEPLQALVHTSAQANETLVVRLSALVQGTQVLQAQAVEE